MSDFADTIVQVLEDPALRSSAQVAILSSWSSGPPREAEDFVQDIMAIALARRREFRGNTPKQVNGWLRVIARNQAVNRIRQRQRRPTSRSILENDLSSETNSSAYIERQETIALISPLLSRNDTAILWARYEEGLGFAQIGKLMGRPEGTVRQSHRRLMKVLRDILTPDQ